MLLKTDLLTLAGLRSGYGADANSAQPPKRCENSGRHYFGPAKLAICWFDPDLMPSTHKKVIVRKMDRDSVNGYVSPANYIVEGKLELLNTSGTVVAIDLNDIKGVYFVREFGDSEDLTRKTFTTRPRTEGLWVRLKFKDNETVEGMMPNDLTQNTSDGFLINPPDLRSNTQRVFVPRSAIASMTVLAVIGATRRSRKGPPDTRQVPMFEQ